MSFRLVFVLIVFICVTDAVSRKALLKKQRQKQRAALDTSYDGGKAWPKAGGYDGPSAYTNDGHSWAELVDYSLSAEIYTKAGLGLTGDDPLQEKADNKFNPRVKKLGKVLVGGYSIGFKAAGIPFPKGTMGGFVKSGAKVYMFTNGHNCVHDNANPFASTANSNGVYTHSATQKLIQSANNDAQILGETPTDIGTIFKFSFGGTPNLDACLVELDMSTVASAGYAPVIDQGKMYPTNVRPVKAPTAGMRLEMPCRTSGYLLGDAVLKLPAEQFTHRLTDGSDVVVTDIFYITPALGGHEASAYGDSGGVWYDPTDGAAVGLNFATQGGRSVAIPMPSVLTWIRAALNDATAVVIRPLAD